MAYTPYTGKSVGALLKVNSAVMPGWKKIVIEETAAPLPARLNDTEAADSAYTTMADPMGAKGTPKTTITIDGLASKPSFNDAGGPFNLAVDTAYAVLFQKATGVDKFAITPVLKRRPRVQALGKLSEYTLTLELDAAETWSAN